MGIPSAFWVFMLQYIHCGYKSHHFQSNHSSVLVRILDALVTGSLLNHLISVMGPHIMMSAEWSRAQCVLRWGFDLAGRASALNAGTFAGSGLIPWPDYRGTISGDLDDCSLQLTYPPTLLLASYLLSWKHISKVCAFVWGEVKWQPIPSHAIHHNGPTHPDIGWGFPNHNVSFESLFYLGIEADTTEYTIQNANTGCESMAAWFRNNKLPLITSKTKVIVCCNS